MIAQRVLKERPSLEPKESDRTEVYYKQMINRANIPRSFKEKSFNNFAKELIIKGQKYNFSDKVSYLKNFASGSLASDPYFVYLAGNVGNGKTHLAIATGKLLAYQKAKELNQKLSNRARVSEDKVYFLYINWRSQIKKIRASYSGNSNYSALEAIRRMELAEILIMDDIFARSKISSSDLDDLFDLIDYRYQRNKKTIITSNQYPDEFLTTLEPKDLRDYKYNFLKKEQLDLITERLGSRILESCGGVVLDFEGLNYRIRG